MNLRPHRSQPPDINLTPLLDVVFLLLIFFMVSTTFKDDARLRLKLPEAQGDSAQTEETESIRIAIDRSGTYYVNDRVLLDHGRKALVSALTQVLGERRDLPVTIQADANSTHQSVMTALDAAAELGLRRVAFAATRPGASDEVHANIPGAAAGGPAQSSAAPTDGPPDLGPKDGEGVVSHSLPIPARPQVGSGP